MMGGFFKNYWAKMGPYYKLHAELWAGLGVTALLFYKLSYGGKKAVADTKPAH